MAQHKVHVYQLPPDCSICRQVCLKVYVAQRCDMLSIWCQQHTAIVKHTLVMRGKM